MSIKGFGYKCHFPFKGLLRILILKKKTYTRFIIKSLTSVTNKSNFLYMKREPDVVFKYTIETCLIAENKRRSLSFQNMKKFKYLGYNYLFYRIFRQ